MGNLPMTQRLDGGGGGGVEKSLGRKIAGVVKLPKNKTTKNDFRSLVIRIFFEHRVHRVNEYTNTRMF